VVKSQRYLSPGFMTHESDRNEDVPWGIFGGQPGHCSKVELKKTSTGEVRYQPAKFSGLRTDIGDVITYYSPVGGGYGNPLERDPGKVLDDVLDEFIDAEHARDAYGVVLREVDDGYGWALDSEATSRLRATMLAAQGAKGPQHGGLTPGINDR
jgi:N-methylhydantoinase B